MYRIVILFCIMGLFLFSCEKEQLNPNGEITSAIVSDNDIRVEVKNGRLYFDTFEQFANVVDKIIIKEGAIINYSESFISLQDLLAQYGDVDPMVLKSDNQEVFESLYYQNGDSYELVVNPLVSPSLLNWNSEVQIGKSIYRFEGLNMYELVDGSYHDVSADMIHSDNYELIEYDAENDSSAVSRQTRIKVRNGTYRLQGSYSYLMFASTVHQKKVGFFWWRSQASPMVATVAYYEPKTGIRRVFSDSKQSSASADIKRLRYYGPNEPSCYEFFHRGNAHTSFREGCGFNVQ